MTNIFEYAKKFEKETEKLYRELAAGCDEIAVADLLKRLADEEKKHYRVVEEMGNGTFPDLAETAILDDTKNVTEELREKNPLMPHA